jgi:hypothetical protein
MCKAFQLLSLIVAIVIFETALFSQNESLVGYWSFDDSTGIDSSGYEQHGTINGDPQPVEGVLGSAFLFDGDDYIHVPDSDLLDTDSSMTISLWIKPDSFSHGGSKFICKWYSSPEQGDWLFTTSSKDSAGRYLAWGARFANYAVYGSAEGVGCTDTSNYLKLHEWNHIAVTFDTGYAKSYYNGTLLEQDTLHIKCTSLAEYGSDDIYIGRYRTIRELYNFFGSIDEVRIYNRELSEEEIWQLFDVLPPLNLKSNTTIADLFTLRQNHPNPFNPITTIEYQLPQVGQVDLSIYTILGQKVATLVSKKQPAGTYEIEWDASGLASGIYLYRLETGDFSQTKKLILLK